MPKIKQIPVPQRVQSIEIANEIDVAEESISEVKCDDSFRQLSSMSELRPPESIADYVPSRLSHLQLVDY